MDESQIVSQIRDNKGYPVPEGVTGHFERSRKSAKKPGIDFERAVQHAIGKAIDEEGEA